MLEVLQRSAELKENLKRLANEMQLREDAETQKAEAEKQTIEAQKQRRNARVYGWASFLLMWVAVLFGVLFAVQKSKEKRVV
jgi:type VI protein secretion system component VasF